MKAKDVHLGSMYVSDRMSYVRHVIRVTKDDPVHYREYELEDGSPTGHQWACSRQQMVKWADRLPTQEEVERLQIGVVTQSEMADEELLRSKLLALYGDREIENELKWRSERKKR